MRDWSHAITEPGFPEVQERAVELVREQTAADGSQGAAITAIAPNLGCITETVRRWMRRAERDDGERPGLTTADRQRVKALERENRERRRANAILRKASAFLAQAEPDRRGT